MSLFKDFTLGIEEEFQIIDPETRDLSHRKHHIIENGAKFDVDIKAEMHQSVVEVATSICKDMKDARNQVVKLRRIIAELAEKDNLKIAAAGMEYQWVRVRQTRRVLAVKAPSQPVTLWHGHKAACWLLWCWSHRSPSSGALLDIGVITPCLVAVVPIRWWRRLGGGRC